MEAGGIRWSPVHRFPGGSSIQHGKIFKVVPGLRRLAAPVLAIAMVGLAFPVPPCGAGPIPPSSQVRVSGVPFVLFHVENDAARAATDLCVAAWEDRGLEISSALVPAGTVTDTIACLVMGTAAFRANFSGRLPDWGVGVALPPGRLIALDHSRLPAVGKGVKEVFLHEMVHALLFQACGEAWLPAWFHEGTAMLYSGEWKFRDTVSLALEGRVPRLDRLRGPFPSTAAGADRAYRTSLLAVSRLQNRHGQEVVLRLVEATARTEDFEVAFYEVTGQSPEEFSQDFDQAMNLRFGWLVMLTRWPGLFVLMGLVFAAGAVRKIIQTRRRLAAMEEEPD